MNQSPKYSLNIEDLKQLGIKLLMVLFSATVTFLLENLKYIDFGQYQVFGSGLIFLVTYAYQRWVTGK